MSRRIIIDPLTRVEGHLGIEVEVHNGKVINARCKGNMFRGFEIILRERDPRDALHLTQRICGVCSSSHGSASAICLENAFNVTPPDNARIIRNLVAGADFLHSHILHFYILGALDYARGPYAPPYIPRYKGDYRLPKEADRVFREHYLKALTIRRLAHELRAIWAGKAPHHTGFVVGGVTQRPSAESISACSSRLIQIQDFIENTYIPDVTAVARAYEDYRHIGGGYGNLLCFGGFNLDSEGTKKFFAAGAYIGSSYVEVDPNMITEYISYSRYNDHTSGRNPADGETLPEPKKERAYSWLKAPRYNRQPAEVGPLARMWIKGVHRERISVIDRHIARALEAREIATALGEWLEEIRIGEPIYTEASVPDEAVGVGLTEAPRGALGHWLRIENSKIAHYQIVTPSTWNISPRDDEGIRGPLEEALIGTPVDDPDNPIELGRVVRSFDPCIACSIHLIKPNGELREYRVA
ncbi:MAG: nickel-dependent hydrogenase large subunit [Candidatus Aureabacteria bacterium]|nr:nickel-dependent hydrogenase large subunit [Candidatus Auribacterota bacterium]